MHCVNGSPVKPSTQEHIGVWLTTWQFAFAPQEPTHGFWHFWLMQAKWLAHSLLLTHSALQLGGLPMKPGKHVHSNLSSRAWQCEFGPHGFGVHGEGGNGSSWAKSCKIRFTKRQRKRAKIFLKIPRDYIDRKHWRNLSVLTCLITSNKRITRLKRWANANRIVIYYMTQGI